LYKNMLSNFILCILETKNATPAFHCRRPASTPSPTSWTFAQTYAQQLHLSASLKHKMQPLLLICVAGVLYPHRAQLQPAVAAQAAVQQQQQRLHDRGAAHTDQRTLRGPPHSGAAAGQLLTGLILAAMLLCAQRVTVMLQIGVSSDLHQACVNDVDHPHDSPAVLHVEVSLIVGAQ
jgi:hypothetical protein